MPTDAQHSLDIGAKYPYDAPDNWRNDDPRGVSPPPATDWAHAAARGVVADLTDRGGIKYGFRDVDQEVRAELVASLAAIIRTAKDADHAAS